MTDYNIAFYNNLLIIFSKIVLAIKILPILIGIWNRHNLNKPLRFLLVSKIAALSIAILVQIFIWTATYNLAVIMPFIKTFKIENTNFFQILYYITDFVFMGFFYSLILTPYGLGKVIKITAIVLLSAIFINYLFIEGYNVYGIFNPLCDTLFAFVISVIYMWFLFNDTALVPLNKNPYFWANLGLIIPSLMTLYSFLVSNKLQQTDFILYVKVSMITHISNIIGLIFISLAFYYAHYTKYLPQDTPSPKESFG
jgi:hypothetical protein